MSASFSAIQLGRLPWQVKWCQETLWCDRPKEIKEVDDHLDEIELALPALADRITGHQRSELAKLLKQIRTRHQHIADQNLAHFISLVDTVDRKRLPVRYHEYLVDETNHRFRQWQKEDHHHLRDLLGTMVGADKRLHGYYDIGAHLGETIDVLKQESGPLSNKEKAYIFSGMKKLALREQIEVGRIFDPTGGDLVAVAKQVKKLGWFLKNHEDDLVTKPKWDGTTIAYRGESEQIKIQDNGVMNVILDKAEDQGWPDAIRLSPQLVANKRSVSNALGHFHESHKRLEFSINGDRVLWGPPDTVKKRRSRSV